MNHGQHESAPQSLQQRHEVELAGPFIAVLTVLSVISLIVPLRPETSVREKRRLREFPAFTVQSLLSGDYFDDIGLWFSDIFPGREEMLEISDRMDAMHGLNRNEVVLSPSASAKNDNADLDALLEQAEAEREAAAAAATPTPAPEATAAPIIDQNTVIEDWEGLKGEDEAAIYGDLVVLDGTVLSRLGFDQTASDHHAALMNQAGDALAAQGRRFFNLPVPTSISILLSSDMLSELGAADQGKTLRYMFARENDNVGKVNAFNNLLAHNSEYLYFNTDHHWTGLGAYYAYQSFCETAGFEPVPLENFTEWNMGAFTGTWYYSVNNRNLKTDEVIALVPPGNDDIHMEILGYPDYTSVIVDETEADSNMKYNCFIAGDNQLTVITNDALPDAPDCLVVKDSFGNPFVVYLTQHYHRIYVLDYRKNFTPVSTVAEQYGVQDVVLVQSIGVSQTRQALPLLENLMK